MIVDVLVAIMKLLLSREEIEGEFISVSSGD